MKTALATFGGILLAMSAAGCQCCGVTERYADLIDDVSDCKPNLDRFYRAELDLNRIGKPDWCRSRINRAICPCACRTSCDCGSEHACDCPVPCLCGDAVSQVGGNKVPVPEPPVKIKPDGKTGDNVP